MWMTGGGGFEGRWPDLPGDILGNHLPPLLVALRPRPLRVGMHVVACCGIMAAQAAASATAPPVHGQRMV
jgi:hypothetical protein